MGVAGFTRFATKVFKPAFATIPSFKHIDHLYIDFNTLVYEGLSAQMSPDPLTAVRSFLTRRFDLYLQHLRPKVDIFICADGVAPVAKGRVQAFRRSGIKNGVRFPLHVLPGTPFMIQ